MGKCLSKTSGSNPLYKDSLRGSTVKNHSLKVTKYESKVASKLQGVHELKKSYKIEDRQILLGKGAFGKVFLSQSIHNSDMYVAIKVLDKDQLKYDIELVM